MSWALQWQTLSRRIGGYLEAVKVFTVLFQATIGQEGRFEHINRVLVPLGRDVLSAVKGLWDNYGDVLPPPATETVKRYSEKFDSLPSAGLAALVGGATILAALKSELDYLLADEETVTIATVERAFEHLQRTIVADEQQRSRWKEGFSGKETWCEQMGATHLLWHGIWAFKVDSKGERTDLVLGIPIGESLVERARASGSRLVLTEWKLVREPGRLRKAIAEATTQLKLYSQGSLAGIELRAVRYAVVVSADRLKMPLDEIIDGLLVRYINIATDPDTPAGSRGRIVRDNRQSPE